jgi:hypothetical protein
VNAPVSSGASIAKQPHCLTVQGPLRITRDDTSAAIANYCAQLAPNAGSRGWNAARNFSTAGFKVYGSGLTNDANPQVDAMAIIRLVSSSMPPACAEGEDTNEGSSVTQADCVAVLHVAIDGCK